MARISGDIWDDLAMRLKSAEEKVPKVMDKAIKVITQRYVLETKKKIYRMKVYDKGTLELAIKPGPIKRTSVGRYTEVWPQGKRYDWKHPKGERNETIGFVNIHGRTGKYAGRDYLSEADREAAPKAVQDVEKILGEVFE